MSPLSRIFQEQQSPVLQYPAGSDTLSPTWLSFLIVDSDDVDEEEDEEDVDKWLELLSLVAKLFLPCLLLFSLVPIKALSPPSTCARLLLPMFSSPTPFLFLAVPPTGEIRGVSCLVGYAMY